MNVAKQIAFSDAEFERRLRAVRESAAGCGLDALLLFSPSNVYYLSGLQELADYSSRTLDNMIATMKPGIPACEVAMAGQCSLASIESRISFHYVWGYPVGVGFPPSWLEESNFFIQTNNSRELLPGMVFHLPLMLRVLGCYGAGFSETVLVTPTGADVLTEVPRQLRVD